MIRKMKKMPDGGEIGIPEMDPPLDSDTEEGDAIEVGKSTVDIVSSNPDKRWMSKGVLPKARGKLLTIST